jgi:cholesterol transport system auxiliary component
MIRIAVVAPLLLTGCISVGIGSGDATLQAQYRLDDLAARPQQRQQPLPRTLVIAAMPSTGIGDTYAMAYSRHPQQRALYQNASWADRPSSRIATLLAQRLDARGIFKSVAELGHGVSGDLVLNLTVNELVHDVAAGQARIELTAELIDRIERTLIARRRFDASAPVAQESARGAVEALSNAMTQALDELVPWLESAAARVPGATAAQ